MGHGKILTNHRAPSLCRPIQQDPIHHQIVEHPLITNGLHPLFGAIDLTRHLPWAPMVPLRRHQADLASGGRFVLGAALMAEWLCASPRKTMRHVGNGECTSEPWWIYNGSTPYPLPSRVFGEPRLSRHVCP